MSNRFDAVMFDFDGTLADTLDDIAAGGNHALKTLGRPIIEVNQYRYLAGQGINSLMIDALGPKHQHLLDQGVDLAKNYQLEHGLDHTKPYRNILKLLDELTQRRIKIAVFSNKPHPATCIAVEKNFPGYEFDCVRGHQPATALKPDPEGAFEIMREVGIAPSQWLYVGDTRADMLTGKSAGMHTVGVLWGFREEKELRQAGADTIIHDPLQLLELIR